MNTISLNELKISQFSNDQLTVINETLPTMTTNPIIHIGISISEDNKE